MSESPQSRSAAASVSNDGDQLRVALSGTWILTGPVPRWLPPQTKPSQVLVRFEQLDSWDSSLALYLNNLCDWCRKQGIPCDNSALPAGLKSLLAQLEAAEKSSSKDRSRDLFTAVGLAAQHTWAQIFAISHFVGECVLSMERLVKNPGRFRWRDCIAEMQECGAMALPIVGLVSFLVGVTMAYTGAVILRLFGGDIWVADLVGLSVTREMGAVMTAVVLAGRTGAAYAAHLGNMKANEEIDALSTLGVSPVDFLVVPRLVALSLMTPLLALYANCMGILGGMLIAMGILSIPPTAYWVEMLTIVDLSDIATGLLKASTFGMIVGMAGCLRGLQAERSAAGVGKAATSAVVTAIILMVVADALYAVIFNILGW
jgi:phospholipid/cholesterol/gamma-HCH transport system permease protein